MMIRIILLWILAWPLWAQEMITKVIDLRYKSAEQIIPLVQPLLQPDEQITGSGQALIVRLTPNTLTQLRTVLMKIDQPPVTFEISVYQGDPRWLSAQNRNVRVISTPSRLNQQRSQSVKVMNGEAAYVSTGTEVPIVTGVGIGWFTGVTYQQHLVEKGFIIEPVLKGSQVQLTIKQVRQQDNQVTGQRFDDQKVKTTMMVPLDEWVALSSAEGAVADQPGKGTRIYTAGNQFSQNSTLYIRVRVIR